jgi:hypothetical protein
MPLNDAYEKAKVDALRAKAAERRQQLMQPSSHRGAGEIGGGTMDNFEISGDGKEIIVTHKVYRHVYTFDVVPDTPPRLSSDVHVRSSDRAAHGHDEFLAEASREAEQEARRRGFAVAVA